MCCYSLNALAVLIQKILGEKKDRGKEWKMIYNKIDNSI